MLAEIIHKDMIEAMKAHNGEKKVVLSLLYNALNLAAKEKKSELSEAEENQIVLKFMKQINETIDSCPPDRTDILSKAKQEAEFIAKYLPHQMSSEEIAVVIEEVLKELNILGTASIKDKGRIMKSLMPKVKGKADGKLVNTVLENFLT